MAKTMTWSTPQSTPRTWAATGSPSPRPVGEGRQGQGAPRVTCHEEVDEVADLGALGLRQPGQMGVRRPAEPESSELLGEPRALDPPERLEELDERDPGRIGCPQEIGRRRARPRRSGVIRERLHRPRLTADGRTRAAQGDPAERLEEGVK